MGLAGNVWEWEETEVDLVNDDSSSFHGLRGGGWFHKGDLGDSLGTSHRSFDDPSSEIVDRGFRVASIPEPSKGLAGDFNQNGVVDAADYTVWRDGLGTTYTQEHYNTWRTNFGATLVAGNSAANPLSDAVPEPAGVALLCVGLVALARTKFTLKSSLGQRKLLMFVPT
jgi:hypothetical protein